MAQNPWKIHARLEGGDRLAKLLVRLGDKASRKWARAGVTKAARIVRRAARDYAAVETGTLKKSIEYKVYAHKKGDGFGAVIGPARGHKRPVTRRKNGTLRAMTRREKAEAERTGKVLTYRDPVHYAHLVEFGHGIAVGGSYLRNNGRASRSRNGRTGKGLLSGMVAPRPFMRPAWDSSRAEAVRIIEEELRKGLEEDARG